MSVVVEVDSSFEGDGERVEGRLPAVCPAGSAAVAGKPLDYRAAERKLDRAVKAAGMDGTQRITAHVLRYNFGSSLIEAGENIAHVSRMLGHSDVATTLGIYVHAVERNERAERSQEPLRAFARRSA